MGHVCKKVRLCPVCSICLHHGKPESNLIFLSYKFKLQPFAQKLKQDKVALDIIMRRLVEGAEYAE